MYYLKCVVCGKMFESPISRRKTCSEECRKEWEKIRGRNYEEKRRIARAKEMEKKEALKRITREAKEAGMSYGQYVAMKEYGMKRGSM